jgi:hypothetical protein
VACSGYQPRWGCNPLNLVELPTDLIRIPCQCSSVANQRLLATRARRPDWAQPSG